VWIQTLQTLVEFHHEGAEVDFQGLKPGMELNDIEAPNASLGPADNGLATAQADRQVQLAQTLRLAAVPQHRQEDLVLGVQRLEHDCLSPATSCKGPRIRNVI
jgi:hypothetical protein